MSDEELLSAIAGLTPADLSAAWDYNDRHSEEIEDAIRANAEA